ncbi:hypothetical protein [Pedobacter sp. MW01-1-1]|uniref:hypothetical protein n=1 Tax=Pedobacter sp. MW01-1-1 TaxID=3383027 RepID=UPI003FF02594
MDNKNKEALDFLVRLGSEIISSKKSTESLVSIELYLFDDLKNPEAAFSEKEFKFSKDVGYYISNSIGYVD